MSAGIIRTRVSLEETEYELVNARASALGISVAEFIRRAIHEMLPAPRTWTVDAIRRVCKRRSTLQPDR